jgi:sensor c-di-GMP phosphodiesterase-like protein
LTSGLPPLLSQPEQVADSPQQIALELTERGFADPKISAPAIAAFRRSGTLSILMILAPAIPA